MRNENLKNASVGALLACIIGNPVTAYSVEKLLAESTDIPTKEELGRIAGVGPATAEKILACCELSARYIVATEAKSVTTPEDVLPRLAWLKYEEQEHFVVVTLDSGNHVIGVHDVTTGLVNKTPAAPREVFRNAVMDNAVSVIIAHNHPSGYSEPSEQDFAITRVLCAAGKVLQIPVLDHVVIGKAGHTSICRREPEIFQTNMSA